jgi:RNA polymerase sigma-70 factor (ECF subfamily)
VSREEEQRLIARVVAGEPAATRELLESYQGAVYAFALRLAGDAALAEDIQQETFLSALRGASSFRAEGSLKGWLLTIARREALAQLRRRHDTPTEPESLESLGVSAGWGAGSPEDTMDEREQQQQMERALGLLSPPDREVLLLRDIEGLSGEETAAALGLPLAAMKSRLHRARLRLVAALRGDTTEDPHGRA